MKKKTLYIILSLLFIFLDFFNPTDTLADNTKEQDYCAQSLASLPGKFSKEKLKVICHNIKVFPSCHLPNGKEDLIYHQDYPSKKSTYLKILVVGLIHGDELISGTLARSWMDRLKDISPRNSWRILPVVNPQGLALGTRTNGNGIDLNRNFPSKNWIKEAIPYWKSKKSQPRYFPGHTAASETETKCIISHIQDFKPDFIISVHTPLGVLDFDGPNIKYPSYKYLPWTRLGNYPGSLGRYMWHDQKIPVLTVELKGSSLTQNMDELDQLQDVSGLLAIIAKNRNSQNPLNNSDD